MRSLHRPSASVLLSLLALFVALGGTSYAVSNQINGALLKDRSVAGVKLKKHTVTATDIDVAGFPKVPSAHQADTAGSAATAGSLDGTINGGQVIGAVGSAGSAVIAQGAGIANTAQNLQDQQFDQIDAVGVANQPVTLVNAGDIAFTCTAPNGTGGTVHFNATDSDSAGGQISVGLVSGNSASQQQAPLAGAQNNIPELTTVSLPVTGSAQVSFTYEQPVNGTSYVVSGTFMLILDNGCQAYGNADVSY